MQEPAEAGARVAVIGGGAIGGIAAAFTARAGHDVTLCVRSTLREVSVRTGDEELRPSLRIATRPGEQAPAAWVLLTTKAQDTAGTVGWLRALCGQDTVLAVLQNGVGHAERVAPLVPKGTEVLPVLVYVSAERTAPGRVVHHVGHQLRVPLGPLGERFERLLAGSGLEVVQVPDFTTAAWRKLLTNVAANPLTALLRQRMSIFDRPDMTRLAESVLSEATSVARADGADVGPQDIRDVLAMYAAGPPDGGTSMLYDRLAGRAMEHEHITGAVVRAGERHSIPTPLNGMLLTLLRALDEEPAA